MWNIPCFLPLLSFFLSLLSPPLESGEPVRKSGSMWCPPCFFFPLDVGEAREGLEAPGPPLPRLKDCEVGVLVMAAGEGGGGRVGTIELLVIAVAVELSFLEVRFVKVVKLK